MELTFLEYWKIIFQSGLGYLLIGGIMICGFGALIEKRIEKSLDK